METLLGLDGEPNHFTLMQVMMRGVVVFFATLIIIGISHKRFLARRTGYDVVLAFILGSMLARAINGSGQLLPTLATGLLLVVMHRMLGTIAFHFPIVGRFLKGDPETIVRDGIPDRVAMERSAVTQHDLEEDLRLNAATDNITEVRVARLERSGEISFIRKP